MSVGRIGLMVLFPLQDDLAALAGLHDVEAFLELVHGEAVGDDGAEVQAGEQHLLHLVPGFPHLAAVDALDGEGLEDDFAPVHGGGGRQDAQLGYLGTVVHVGHHVAEGYGRTGHLQAYIKTAYAQAVHGLCHGLALGGVDGAGGTHLAGYVQTVFAQVCHHDVLGSGKLGYGCGHGADEACAGDEDVLAQEGEGEGRVGGIAEGVHDGGHVIADAIVQFHHVALGDGEVFGKGTVAVDAHADAVLADVLQSAAAVAAVSAGDVALTCDAVAHLDVAHAGAYLFHYAHVLVAYGHGGMDGFLAPLVPLVDVQVGAADGGLLDLDEDIVHAHLGHGNVFHPQALAGFFLD